MGYRNKQALQKHSLQDPAWTRIVETYCKPDQISEAAYAACFTSAKPSQRIIDCSPFYAHLPIEGFRHLLCLNPQATIDKLVDVDDDSLTQEAILLGLFDSRAPSAGEAARLVKRIGYGRADSMALILIAKHADHLSKSELQDLGVMASGGRVSAVLQAQAGWLYLKHAGQLEQTLAVIFADP